jgi:hypothetical protein
MPRVTINTSIRCYEINGSDEPGINARQVQIRSHGLYDERCVLVMPDGQTFTILRADLSTALAAVSHA